MAIGREMKRTFRRDKKTDNEWSDHSKSMRSAGGSPTTSAIKRVAKGSLAVPTTSTSIARSGYAKKLRTQKVQGKSQISYKKPNTTAIPTPTMTSSISRAVEKRDYAVPENRVGLRTKAKTIGKYKTRWGR